MRAAPAVERSLLALAVGADAMASAAAMAASGGAREPDAAQRLYREWVNDTVLAAGTAWFRKAAQDPSAAFLEWAEARAADPWHVTFRAHEAMRAAYGDNAAMMFTEVRWRQEVSWARRMRGSDNDRISVLAEAWLTAARRDPGKLFRGIVATYAEDGVSDPVYSGSTFHMLTRDEILDGKVDDLHWRPLWLRFAEREFGRRVSAMPRPQMTQLAARVRGAELGERTGRSRSRQADAVRARRPSLMIGILGAAVAEGLSSDDLVSAEADFVARIETGEADVSSHPGGAWRAFAAGMPKWAGRCPPPGPAERAARIAAIEGLAPAWANGLPEQFGEIGADRACLAGWFDEVANKGSRQPPSDPAVDYGMWLAEARARGGRAASPD